MGGLFGFSVIGELYKIHQQSSLIDGKIVGREASTGRVVMSARKARSFAVMMGP